MSYLQLVAVGLAAITLAGAATPRAMAQNAVAPLPIWVHDLQSSIR